MIVAFDLETTGLDPQHDRIIEISMIRFDEQTFEIQDEFTSFVDPECEIPELISNITHIFDKDVAGAPKFSELKKEVAAFIGEATLLGHNVSFDISFLNSHGIDTTNNQTIDTFFLANFLSYKANSLNLEMLAHHYGFALDGAHRARNDVLATISLLQHQLQEIADFSADKRQILEYILLENKHSGTQSITNLLQIDDTKTIYFDEIEEILLQNIQKLSFGEQKSENKGDKLDIDDFFSEKHGIEYRENQHKMALLYKETLDKNKKIIIEAPTGLGKSFAYLVPAIASALTDGKQIFVSTKTKTLQDQLVYKDLLFLHKEFSAYFSYTKLKGKANYISLVSFFQKLAGKLSYAEVSMMLKIAFWLFETHSGELDELNFYPQEYFSKSELTAESFQTLSEKNPYSSQEFYAQAKKRAETADIVVINHALLFANTKDPLFEMKHLVIDEAHSIEDAVTDALKRSYTRKFLEERLGYIELQIDAKKLKKIDFIRAKTELLATLQTLDDIALHYLHTKVAQDARYKTTLVKKDFYEELDFQIFLEKLTLKFQSLVDALTNYELDLSRELLFIKEAEEVIIQILTVSSEDYIKILTFSERYGLKYEFTLLSPANYLQKELWASLDSCLLTSATLTIGGSFEYFVKILGIGDFGEQQFVSDFDYNKQATLIIPNSLGSIKHNSSQILDFLLSFYAIVGGKVLTLLTSFSMIKKIYLHTYLPLQKEGIQVYAQSLVGSKQKLLTQFTNHPENAILLGTGSFWEGVDIGPCVQYLVIHKFPFPVPTDPIFVARSALFTDAFKEYAIPKAVLMLKQGFGRLIRSKTDTGVIVLLDDRIISTGWGNAFFDAFPADIRKKIVSADRLLELLQTQKK